MDLYVKLQGPKHNSEKVQGCFCKITWADEILELMNYFSKGKSMNRVYAAVDLAHTVHHIIKPRSLVAGWMARIQWKQRAMRLLISALDLWVCDFRCTGRRKGPAWRRHRGGSLELGQPVATELGFLRVSLYGIGERRRTRCTYLREAAGGRHRQGG
jgi:hypothetical protein